MQITKDDKYILIQVPDRDINSMVRFIAHGFVANQNLVTDLCHEIVTGDLTKQDDLVAKLKRFLELSNYQIVLDGPEALQLCDELAETVYEEQPEPKERQVARICVHCHKAYLGECKCPESKRAQMRLVK
jgi:hypothetical protein